MVSQERTVTVPSKVLKHLLAAEAVASAHYNLCQTTQNGSREAIPHPGDPLGEVAAWLWESGQHDPCVLFVADYLAEMRVHNPNSPEDGARLTWDGLKYGLSLAVSHRLEPDQTQEMLDYLSDRVPRIYGEAPKRLNTP